MRVGYLSIVLSLGLVTFVVPHSLAGRSGHILPHPNLAPAVYSAPHDGTPVTVTNTPSSSPVPPTATTIVSNTATASATSSSTPTASVTPTATTTPIALTATITPTATATAPANTPTLTLTNTATATATPTRTSTATSTRTPAPTATATPRATLSVKPHTINPGGVLTVQGTGFLANEKVDIGLDKNVLADVPANSSGKLTPTGIVVPLPTTAGSHTLYVLGHKSRRRAQLTVKVDKLTPSLQLDHTTVAIGTRLCATGTTFLPGETVTLAINSVATAAPVASNSGKFTICFAVPANILSGRNDVTATGSSSHATAIAHVTGQLAIASTAYFVGANTSMGADTELPIVNPQPLPANVTLTFYLPTTAAFQRMFTIAAYTRMTIALSQYVANVSGFGVRVEADRVIAAQMVVHRGANNPYATSGSSLLEQTWYLAEGFTGLSFHEQIYILNPQKVNAHIALQLLRSNGVAAPVTTYTIAAERTARIDVNRLLPRASIAALVSSDTPVMVTRVLTFGDHAYGATANTGTFEAATNWQFAEGSAAGGFQTFLTILNPEPVTTTVTAIFYDPAGRVLGGRSVQVAPEHRGTIRVNDTTQAGAIATMVSSSVPVVVERPFYFGNPNSGRTGGSIVYGRNGGSLSWTFPDGDTTGGIREYLLALNPNATPLQLHASFYLTDGRVVGHDFTVPANARLTIDVANMIPEVANSVHASRLTATNNVGFIAEQTIYSQTMTSGYSTVGLAQ